jgi:acyl carrier protein
VPFLFDGSVDLRGQAFKSLPTGVMDMTKDDIFAKVKATLVDSLNVDDDEVTLASRLQADLNAESIDFLDIVFRLEREFGIKIPRGELFPESIFQGDPELVQNGKITDVGMAELEKQMPFANKAAIEAFKKDRTLESIGDLFTVEAIVNYIDGKVKAA